MLLHRDTKPRPEVASEQRPEIAAGGTPCLGPGQACGSQPHAATGSDAWATTLPQEIAEQLRRTCRAAQVDVVRTARSPSGDGSELDLVVRYPADEDGMVRAALTAFGCRWTIASDAGRLVRCGVVQHGGRICYVHAYLQPGGGRRSRGG